MEVKYYSLLLFFSSLIFISSLLMIIYIIIKNTRDKNSIKILEKQKTEEAESENIINKDINESWKRFLSGKLEELFYNLNIYDYSKIKTDALLKIYGFDVYDLLQILIFLEGDEKSTHESMQKIYSKFEACLGVFLDKGQKNFDLILKRVSEIEMTFNKKIDTNSLILKIINEKKQLNDN